MKKRLVTLDSIGMVVSAVCLLLYLFMLESHLFFNVVIAIVTIVALLILWVYIRMYASQKSPHGIGCVPGIVFANAGILHYHHLDRFFDGAIRTLIVAIIIMVIELAAVYLCVYFFRNDDSENDDQCNSEDNNTTLHEPLLQ